MKIVIDGKEFTQDEMDVWKRKRVGKVLKNLKKPFPISMDTDEVCQYLTNLKLAMSYTEITSLLKPQIRIGYYAMKFAAIFSRGRRRAAITTLYAEGITAADFSKIIDALMLEDTKEHQEANLAACPDHYVLRPFKDTLEVIETAGNTFVPTQFYITFHAETGLIEPRDVTYPFQSTGIAKLKDGTIIGGVRHQFKDTPLGLEVRALVEFPRLCPKSILKEHQKHLAVEWSNWLLWAIAKQSHETAYYPH